MSKLIRAASNPASGEIAAARVLQELLSAAGIECEIDAWDSRRANFVARMPSRSTRPPLVFLAHLDVVDADPGDWSSPPFEPTFRQGRLYGRGSADMKGGIAAIAEAMRRTVHSGMELLGDVYLVAVAGEETDSAGIQRFMKTCPFTVAPVGVVVCEPTGLEVATAHRGIVWLRAEFKGHSSHGSMPHLGVNAIYSALTFIERLREVELATVEHPRLGRGTLSVNRICGGAAVNIVPDRCSIDIDIRTVPGQHTSAVLQAIEQLKRNNQNFDTGIAVLKQVEALQTPDDCEFVRQICRAAGVAETTAVGFTTDGPNMAALGAPVLVCGPGEPQMCHSVDESVEIMQIERAADIYEKVIRAVQGPK